MGALGAVDAVDPDVDIGDVDASRGDGDPLIGITSSMDTSSKRTSSIGASGGDEITAVIVAGYHKPSSCKCARKENLSEGCGGEVRW